MNELQKRRKMEGYQIMEEGDEEDDDEDSEEDPKKAKLDKMN